MKAVKHAVRLVPGLALCAVLLSGGIQTGCFGLDAPARPAKNETPADMLELARGRDPDAARAAIGRLGDVSTQDERDNNVTSELLSIVEKSKDPFVRRQCVLSLGRIQAGTNRLAKGKFLAPLSAILKDTKGMSIVRRAVAQVFRDVLDREGLPDRDAYKIVLDIAANKNEQNLSLRGECIQAAGAFASVNDGLPVLANILNEQDNLLKEYATYAIFAMFDHAPEAAKQVSLPTVNKLVEMLKASETPDELKAAVMRVIAQLIREGNVAANAGREAIMNILAHSTNEKLLLGAVEAMGLIGTTEAVAALQTAYNDYLKDTNDKAIHIRQGVMKALRSVLSAQAAKPTGADSKTVHEAITLIIKAVDDDKAEQVKAVAVYSAGYYYPFLGKYKADESDAVNALINLMKLTTGVDMKAKVLETLEALTNVSFDRDMPRWEEWFKKKYGR